IAAVGAEAGAKAREMVMAIVAEPIVGTIYEGPVKSITAFGAFVEIMPGVEGLLHISELDHKRVEKTEDVVKKGDIVQVKLLQLDDALFRTDCPNGLVVVTERIPGVRSAAAGIWVRTASGHEARPKMGVSHLLEHLVFKGTERRTAREIAMSLESRGGSLD